jgi:hypothetical protein
VDLLIFNRKVTDISIIFQNKFDFPNSAKSVLFSNFPENPKVQGGFLQNPLVFFAETGSSYVEASWTSPLPPHAHARDTEEPLELPICPTSSFPPFFLSCPRSLSPPAEHLQPPPWPPLSAAVPRHPRLRRHALELRLVLQDLPVKGVEPGCLKSPPPSPFPRRRPSSTVVNCAAERLPPAKRT